MSENLSFSVGGRYDSVRLKVRDRRGEGEASGREQFEEFSLSAGPVLRFHPRHRFYATLGTAFETPTFTELYDPTEPDEGFDPGLSPQQALNMEMGIKGVLAERTRYDLALFRVITDDEIVQIDDEPDRFANAGETRRDGMELGIEHFLTSELSLSGAYTWSDFRFREYEDEDGNDLRGNRLPGLPEHNLFAELAWRDAGGWYAMVDALVLSRVYADDGNTESVSGYGVVNSRIGRTTSLGGAELEGFLALNNVLDREYPANVRINSGDNFLEPAPERNIHTGVRVSF